MMDAMAQALVGRLSERRQLLDGLVAAQNRNPVTVLIEGEPGVGKSSLVDWFTREAAGRQALVLSGACIELSGGAAIPYSALTEALRLFVRREGLEQAEKLAGPAWPTLGRLISDFTGRPGPTAALDPQPRVFGAVLRLSDHIRRYAPLVLVFEDVHWADRSTLDLIRYLTKAKTDERLMLVCSYRSGLAARHPLRTLLGEPDFSGQARRLVLAPFGRADLDAFVTAVAGRTVPPQRLQRYFELSEGNAYFAEQLVTADDFQNTEVEVPASLRELMLARITQLSEEAADVVRVAAVAGRRLSDDLLAAVCDLDDQTLEQALRECVRQRILIHDGTDDAYAFQHALLRDTAYQWILPRTRKRLHARIAQALSTEARAATRLVPELAYHWFEAGRMHEAFAAAVRAGGLAVQMHAFQEAQAQFERALRLWPEIADGRTPADGTQEALLGSAADAARWAGDVNRALDWIRQAIAQVDPSQPGRLGELYERLGSYLWEAGQPAESATAYREADRLLAGLPASAVGSRVQSALATAAVRAGDYTAGLERARRAADLARAVGARTEEGRALNSMGLALAFQGAFDEGEQALRAALAIATEVDHLEDLFRAYGNLGVCLEHAGRLDRAVAAMQEGLERAKDHGLLHTRQSGVLANNAAAALSLLGRWDEAAELLDSILLERPIFQTLYARLTRAEIAVAVGEFDHAERLLAEIRSRPNSDPRFVGPLYGCMAELAAWQGRLDEARSIVERGREAIGGTENARVMVQLCAVGLRVAADLRRPAGTSGGRGAASGGRDAASGGREAAPGGRDAILDWADDLMADVRRVAADPPDLDETSLLTRLCQAERARADAADTPAMWAAIADGWAAAPQPYRMAYARWCEADAAARSGDRGRAASAAREAYAEAERLHAGPLLAYIAERAGDRRLRLGPPRPYGLTAQELNVLRELAAGRTNKEIAEALFISVNTAGVHIGNILRKLGVRNRSEAGELARRERLIPG